MQAAPFVIMPELTDPESARTTSGVVQLVEETGRADSQADSHADPSAESPAVLPVWEARFVIPEDVLLRPISDLPPWARSSMEHKPTDYVIGRRYSRGVSRLVSEATGLLLEEFRTPQMLVDAMIAFSQRHTHDAEQVLDSAGPLLLELASQDLLSVEGSELASGTKPTLEPGETVLDLEIVRCYQLLEDTEVYQARGADDAVYALKIARVNPRLGGIPLYIQELFAREARILGFLRDAGCEVQPRLHSHGELDGRPYLAIEWIDGVPLSYITAGLQVEDDYQARSLTLAARKQRLDLACRLLDAYAALHAAGVLHTDVHTRNVMLDPDGSMRVIDFGFGRLLDEDDAPRAGVLHFYDPQYAAALVANTRQPPVSPASEQYSIAVIVYSLLGDSTLAGGEYVPFSMDMDETLRQIAEEPALPLTSYFNAVDPRLDDALLTALAKEPDRRFASVAAFRDRLKEIAESYDEPGFDGSGPAIEGDAGRRCREGACDGACTGECSGGGACGGECACRKRAAERRNAPGQLRDWQQGITGTLLQLTQPDERWFEYVFRHSPSCSVNYGGAGIAYALYHMAQRRQDPRLLERADLWIAQTDAHLKDSLAFNSRAIEINEASVGKVSPYHSESGVRLVQALIAHSFGDPIGCQAALDQFVRAATQPCDNLDLTLGTTAVLLGCATLLDALEDAPWVDLGGVRSFGTQTLSAIWDKVAGSGPVAESKAMDYLGIAHGWSGLCYGALRWCAASGDPVPADVLTRVEELVEMALVNGRGVTWGIQTNVPIHGSGWCNGTAGWVHLWTEAYAHYRDDRYLVLAEKTGESTWAERDGVMSLCCGSAGKAYALLNLYRATGDVKWLRRGRKVAQHAIEFTATGWSLYKSMTGVGVLAEDISDPDTARMPLFERECAERVGR